MKTRVRRTALAVCALSTLVVAGTVAGVGCGGDDTQVGPGDGGNDGTTGDVSVDHAVPPDGMTDGGGGDAADGNVLPDGHVTDAPVDAPSPADFLPTVAKTVCGVLRQCCNVTTAKWNETQCETDFSPGGVTGGFRHVNRYSGSAGSTKIVYDTALAAKCIADIQSILVTQPDGGNLCGQFPSSFAKQIPTDCIGALRGTVPWDGGSAPNDGGNTCTYHNECLPGGFCGTNDGGPSTCQPIHATNQPCTPTPGAFSEDCNYLGLGTPGDYCEPTSKTCQPQLGPDGGCQIYDTFCQSDLCFGNCSDFGVFSDPNTPGGECAGYTLP